MGTIKDINDLILQIHKSVKDRDLVAKLTELQTLFATLQSENFALQSRILEGEKKILIHKENEVNYRAEIVKLRNKLDNSGGGGLAGGVVTSDHF